MLDELLAARPDLRQAAEAYAARIMSGADRSAVADDVENALQGLGIEELNTRAGDNGRAGVTSIRPRPPTRSWTRPCNPSWTTFSAAPASRHAIRSRRTRGGYPARPVQLPSRQLRDAAGVLSGLRGRTHVRRGERLREARHRATRRRTPRPHARMERPAALSPRSTRASLGCASGRRPAPSSCLGTPARVTGRTRRSATSGGTEAGICSRTAAAAYHGRGCECRPAGLRGGRHEDQPWPIRTTNGSARARR